MRDEVGKKVVRKRNLEMAGEFVGGLSVLGFGGDWAAAVAGAGGDLAVSPAFYPVPDQYWSGSVSCAPWRMAAWRAKAG